MSDSEDEDYAYYGTALPPLDEDNLPRKKPILIQDQIATDKHGRRRFHGAFTGGFSAGFFNSVGSLEGWTPSAFKSSRSSKADGFSQKPEDFMDEEDTEEFGIAPTLLRAKPEYSGSVARSKRKLEISTGPIPGDPVLQNFIEPPSITVGMKLLMKLGWKPGQGIGPMLTWLEKMGDDVNPEEMGLKADVLFPPTAVQEHIIKPKSDRFGLGYSGLSREPVLQERFTLFDDPLKVNENKKKLSIRGQAFGVGAFEDEDDDIYAKDDMSRYDFALETSASLKEARRKERQKEREQLAICEASDCLEGYVRGKSTVTLMKHFPPPELPPDFDVKSAGPRASRFNSDIRGDPDAVKGKHIINAADRAAILGETQIQKAVNLNPHENSEVTSTSSPAEPVDMSFRPFITDPRKQARYDRYLGLIRIGAKDALKNIQPADMSDWEKEREAQEFDQAAKLYRPLSGMMNDRFSRSGFLEDTPEKLSPVPLTDPATEEVWVKAAREKKFGKLTRFISDWDPAPILCKRMNIPEPRGSGVTLANIAEEAKKRKPKFSVFDFIDSKNNYNFGTEETRAPTEPPEIPLLEKVADKKEERKISLPEPLLDPKIIEAEDPRDKMDLFKAIFASSDEESDSEDSKKESSSGELLEMDKVKPNLSTTNVLRNTSPPRGIFANIDLDSLKPKPMPLEVKTDSKNNNKNEVVEEKSVTEEVDPNLLYGPSLPSKPVFISKSKPINETSSSEEEWVEKGKEEKKNKKEKKKDRHSKKHKKEKKKDRHKHKKKKKS